MIFLATFAQRIKQLREDNNLTLEEFAAIFHTFKPTIWRYEKGEREPSIDFVREVAIHFNVSMDWLAGLSDEREITIIKELSNVYSELSQDKRNEVIDFAKYIKNK